MERRKATHQRPTKEGARCSRRVATPSNVCVARVVAFCVCVPPFVVCKLPCTAVWLEWGRVCECVFVGLAEFRNQQQDTEKKRKGKRKKERKTEKKRIRISDPCEYERGRENAIERKKECECKSVRSPTSPRSTRLFDSMRRWFSSTTERQRREEEEQRNRPRHRPHVTTGEQGSDRLHEILILFPSSLCLACAVPVPICPSLSPPSRISSPPHFTPLHSR